MCGHLMQLETKTSAFARRHTQFALRRLEGVLAGRLDQGLAIYIVMVVRPMPRAALRRSLPTALRSAQCEVSDQVCLLPVMTPAVNAGAELALRSFLSTRQSGGGPTSSPLVEKVEILCFHHLGREFALALTR